MESEKKKVNEKFWIYAFRDNLAGIQAYSNCIDTCDLYGDGDFKFLVADGNRKLRVFGGTSLQTEARLLSVPSAMTTFYADGDDAAQRPVVAVACGPHVFTYRNMKPLYRFTVHPVELDPVEIAVWGDLRMGTFSVAKAVDILEDRRRNGVELSTRSIDLLASDIAQERESLVASLKDVPLKQLTIVVCMTSLYLDRTEEKSRGCLVLGTENQYLYVLKSNASEVKLRLKLPSAPVCIVAAGAFTVNYRIIVACRDACIYSIKNNKLSKSVIHADAHIVQIARYDNLVAVATARNTLTFYNLKGKRQSCVFLPCPVACISVITEFISGKARGVVVALDNATLRVYVGKVLIHESPTYGNVTAMRFGHYGREEAALLLVLQNGSLVVQMLHRHASFECAKAREVGPPPEQDIPIPVPSLTSVFVAQSERERLYGADMHQSFQRDLCRLRLSTAKLYLKMIGGSVPAPSAETAGTSLLAPQSMESNSVRMLTTVQGIGPVFKIRVTLQNVTENPIHQISAVLIYDTMAFRVPTPVVAFPFLVPTMLYNSDFLIERITENAIEDTVRVCVCRPSSFVPLAEAVIDLPEEELLGNGI